MEVRTTEKPIPTPPQQHPSSHEPTASQTLDLLRFVALSTSVHADAVQAAADATEAALLQMRSDEETLNYLDLRLQGLLKDQRRLHEMHEAIARSKEARRQTDSLLREQQRRLEAEQDRAYGLSGKCIQSSRRPQMQRSKGYNVTASCDDEDGDANELGSASGSLAQRDAERAVGSIDAEVERTKRLVAETNRTSIRAKLLELETLKGRVRNVDGKALAKELVVGFRFPPEVEELWGGREESAEEVGSGGEKSRAGSTAAASRASAAHPKRSTRRLCSESEETNAELPRCHSVVNHTNIDLLLARATQRFTGRYKDALEVLTRTAMDSNCSPQQAFGSLLYADYLDAADGNPDASAVQALQAFGRSTLADHYTEKCSRAVVDQRISDECLTGSGANTAGPSPSVLSAYEFCALPTKWTATAALTALPEDELLPPARHVLTERFSFSDVKELRSLEKLRVDIQRQLVKDVVHDKPLLDDMLSARARACGCVSSKKDRFVAEARMAVASAAVPGKPHAWPTVALATGDE